MPKVIIPAIEKHIKMDFDSYNVTENVRTDLRVQIESHWLRPNGHIFGMQFLALGTNGLVKVTKSFERRDILVLQWHTEDNYFNVFVTSEKNGAPFIDYQECDKTKFTDNERIEIAKRVNNEWVKRSAYVARHVKFYAEEPWKQCDGLSVVDTITKLKALGW